jgi:hypothetical protein
MEQPEQAPPEFRLQAKNVFLTFAQCPISKERALVLLSEKKTIEEYVIAEELHEDGNKHLHCFLKFATKLHTRDARFFDLTDDEVVYHPNITKPRSVKNVIQYIEKDNNYLSSDGIKRLLNKKSWGEIKANATSTVEYLNGIAEHYPRDYALNYERLKVFSDIHFKEDIPIYKAPFTGTFIVPDVLNEWANTYIAQPQRDPKVLHTFILFLLIFLVS